MPEIYSFFTKKLIKIVESTLPRCFLCNGTGRNLVPNWKPNGTFSKYVEGKCNFCRDGLIDRLVDRDLYLVSIPQHKIVPPITVRDVISEVYKMFYLNENSTGSQQNSTVID